MHWRTLVLATLLCAVTSLAHEPRKHAAAPADPKRVVATVGTTTITEGELATYMPADVKKRMESARDAAAGAEIDAARELVLNRCIEQEARRRGISEDALYREELERNRDRLPAGYASTLLTLRENIYQSRRQALDAAIERALVTQEAKERGVSADALFDMEVGAKAAVPPAEVELIVDYELARQRSARPREEMRKQVEQTLREARLARRQREFLLSLRQRHEVRTMLEPPRVAVTADDDPVRGRRDAPVQVVVFSEFQCPFCARVEPVLDRVHSQYGDRVAIVFRDFPLPTHEQAMQAAEAAGCAGRQGKFWEYHKLLFANQADLSADGLRRRAEDLGLDTQAFGACLASGEMRAEIRADVADGERAGVAGTPALFVNGRFFGGAPTYEDLTAVIDEELRAYAAHRVTGTH